MRTRHTGKYLVLSGIAGIALVTGCMNTDGSSADETEIAYSLRSELSGSPDGKKTYVCHIPPGNPANAHTIHVGNAAVDAHLAHGDSLGQCGEVFPPDTGTARCHAKMKGKKSIQNVISRKGKSWKVTVCHIPPGNPENSHEISVGAPAVRAHLAHGDSLGSCSAVVDTGTVALDPDDCTDIGKGGNGGTGEGGTGGTGEGGTGGTGEGGTGGTGEGGTGGTGEGGTGGTGEGGTGGTGGSDSTSIGDNT